MFAVLQVEKYEKGLLNRFQNLFDRNKVKLNYYSVKGAAPFFVMKVKEGKNGVDWEKVSIKAGGCAESILVSKNIQIPVSCGLSRFEPKLLQNVLLFNNMLEILKRLNNNNISVTVLDKEAGLVKNIDRLFDYARHITVLTDDFPRYKVASQRIMDSCGGAIVLKEYDSDFEKSDIVFSDQYNEKKLKNCGIVFCPDNESLDEKIISGYDAEFPEHTLKNKPDGIDSFVFVSALYELNSLKGLDDLMFSKLIKCNEKIEKSEVVAIIEQLLHQE